MLEKVLTHEIELARSKKVFSHAYCHVFRHGQEITEVSCGDKSHSLYYDLASLTKPLGLAVLVIRLVTLKQLSLDDKISDVIPVAPYLQSVTVLEILNHDGGLIDWYNYFALHFNRIDIFKDVATNPLFSHGLKRTTYSDLGYILLTYYLETRFKMRLDQLLITFIFEPQKIQGLHFIPLDQERFNIDQYVPTEHCIVRHRLIQAEVMDENAWRMNGISGHAGLFATGPALSRLIKIVQSCFYNESSFLDNDLLKKHFSQAKKRDLYVRKFFLGFDTPTYPNSQTGSHFSDSTIGHLGFSGTSFWWDMEQNVTVVLLANRCLNGRRNIEFTKFRPKLHDLIMKNIL